MDLIHLLGRSRVYRVGGELAGRHHALQRVQIHLTHAYTQSDSGRSAERCFHAKR